jgi:seryl-tRNA synthetase
LWQAADFADHVASGSLTSEYAAEIERLRAHHTDAVQEKSTAENKRHRLTERLAATEAEKGDLWRQLVEERRDANKAIADAQAAQAEAKLAWAEASLACQRVEELEARLNSLRNRVEKTEASTHAEVERTHAQLVDAYRELGARTTAFEAPGQEVGLRFLEWLQEELGVLPTIVMGLMSFASLVTCEGAVNALSREGCGHFEVFDQSDEDFECEIF